MRYAARSTGAFASLGARPREIRGRRCAWRGGRRREGAGAAAAASCASASAASPLRPCHPAGPTKRGSGSIAETSSPQISPTRRVIVVSSIAFRNATSSLPSSFGSARSSSGVSTATSRTSVTRLFEIRTRSTFSGAVSASRRLGCLISPARASSDSRSPYSPMSCAAVLTPMPGAPGTLSVEFAGQRLDVDDLVGPDAEIFDHLGGADLPLLADFARRAGSYIATPGSMSCIRSLSAETISTSAPRSRA